VPSREKLDLKQLNPFAPLRWAFSFAALAPLLAMFLIFAINGDIPGTIWVLYGVEKFGWDNITLGGSFAVFGLCSSLAQAFLTGPIAKRFGEKGAIIIGVCADVIGFTLVGLATEAWMPFALAPFFALGGVGLPALQSLMSAEVSEDRQGELQGVLASAMSLTSIIGPLLATGVYFWTKPVFIGAVWIMAAALYLLAIPVLGWVGRRKLPQPA
jgi:DHA1 family tetracycline resistance protein-like MFS transporter